MYPAYTQLVAEWSSPSIGDQRATGCAYQPKKNGKQNSHVASKVAEPDVVAGVSEKEAERFASISDHPVSGGAEQPVLSMFILRYFMGTLANLIEF